MSASLDFFKITGLNKWMVFSVYVVNWRVILILNDGWVVFGTEMSLTGRIQINDISQGNLQRVQVSI